MAHLIDCPVCKREVSSNADACPGCGERIRKLKCRSVKGGFISLIGGMTLGILFCWIGGNMSQGSLSTHPLLYLGILIIIASLISTCICFTSPSK